jgi:hypothetical protein
VAVRYALGAPLRPLVVSYYTRKQTFIMTSYVHMYNEQCPDEIVPDKSTSTILRNASLAHKQDSSGSLLLKTNQLNRIYM